MLSRIISTAALFAIFALPTLAHARVIKMVFWYPGEAGSTVEAQPILDEFCKYLNEQIAPDTVSGKYFNAVADGLAYIQKDKPGIGIVSFAAWAQNKDKLGDASVMLSVLPGPKGKNADIYTIVGANDKIGPTDQLLSSEPMSVQFARDNIFGSLPPTVRISQTPQMLMKLKTIADGGVSDKAILTPTEALSLSMISAEWAKKLKTIAQSKPVPTARVVLFDKKLPEASKLKDALLLSGRDPKAKEVMDEMRLKGFAEE